MDEFGKAALREREAVRIARRQWFWLDLIVWGAISAFLFVIWVLAGGGFPWFVIPTGAWAIVVAAHAGRGGSIQGLEVDANPALASQPHQGHRPRVSNRHSRCATVLHQRRRAAMPV